MNRLYTILIGSLLFDKNKILVYHGAIDNSNDPANVTREHAKLAINDLLEGEPIFMSETRAIGCAIKRVAKQE